MNKTGNHRILAIMGYEGFYGAERANLKVLKMFRDGGVDVEFIVVRNGGDILKKALSEAGFIYHPAAFGPSYFGLSLNPVHYLKNLIGMIRVFLKVLAVAREYKPTRIYVPNYIQFIYVWFALLWLRVPAIHRIGDPPENNALHRFLWKIIIAPRVSGLLLILNTPWSGFL